MENQHLFLWKKSTRVILNFLKSRPMTYIYIISTVLVLFSFVYDYSTMAQRLMNQRVESYQAIDQAARDCFYGEKFDKGKDAICLAEITTARNLINKYKLDISDLGYKLRVLLEYQSYIQTSQFLSTTEKAKILKDSKDRIYALYSSQELFDADLKDYSDYQKIYFIRFANKPIDGEKK
jgi:hypothetical protein